MKSQKNAKLLTKMTLGEAPVWHYCYDFNHFGVHVDICVDIYWTEENPTQIKVCASFNGHRGCYQVDVSDVACIPIEVPYIDVGFKICFDHWHVTDSEISFDITLKACAFFCITVYSYNITIPTAALVSHRAGKMEARKSQLLIQSLALNTPKHF